VQDKLCALQEWLAEHSLDSAQVVYVGNDINDLSCMRVIGCAVTVADAHPDVLSATHIVLDARGGHGAVREIAEMIAQHLNGGGENDAKSR